MIPEPNSPGPKSVQLVLPCLDEAAALPAIFRRIPPEFGIVLVDNGSQDGSGELARQLGAQVVREPRRGYGAAVHAGLAAATADVVAVMDCDGSLDPAELLDLVQAVVGEHCDLATGWRRPVQTRSWPWHARAGNRVLAGVLSRSAALTVRDLGPVRVGRRLDLLALDIRDRRSGYPVETLIKAAAAGWRIQEFPMSYSRRSAGTRSKVSGSVRGTVLATADILRLVHRQRASR